MRDRPRGMGGVCLPGAPTLVFLLAPLVAACGGSASPKQPQRMTAEVSTDIATVVRVHWTTDVPTTGHVEFGSAVGSLSFDTPLEGTATQDHTATLLGLPADAVAYFRVVSTESGAPVATSDVGNIRTGALPVGFPTLTRTGSGYDGFIVVPILGTMSAVVIINGNGDIVWYHTEPAWASTGDSHLESYRARLSRDGKSVICNSAKISGEPSQDSALIRVSLDGSRSTSIPIPLLAHDFVELPDGTLGAIAFEDRTDANGTRVRGNKIVEVAPDGTQTTVWTSWDCFDPATAPGDDPSQGWTFSNALDYDPTEDVYYVGLRNFSSIAKVHRTTRACEWVLGTYGATFKFAQGSPHFLHEHQFEVTGNHILIMDNDGARTSTMDQSRVLEYQLDYATMEATEVWSYIPTPPVYTFVLGEPIRLADGGVFVNWSTAGQMERVDSSGASTWKLNSGAGFAFGFQTLAADLYAGGAQ